MREKGREYKDRDEEFKKLSRDEKSLLADLMRGDKMIWGFYNTENVPCYKNFRTSKRHTTKIVEQILDRGYALTRPQEDEELDHELVITKSGRVFCKTFGIGMVD